MLRIIALGVALSIAVLFVTVARHQPSDPVGPEAAGEAAGPAASARRSASSPRGTSRRIAPRLPDLPERVDPSDLGDGEGPAELEEPGPRAEQDDAPGELAASPAEATDDYDPTYEDQDLLQRALAFVEDFASAIEDNSDSCDRMADALEATLSRSKDLLAQSESMRHQPDRKRWFAKQSEELMMPRMTGIIQPLQACIGNERVMSVLNSYKPG